MIGDKDSVLGFLAAGFHTFVTEDPKEAAHILENAVENGFASAVKFSGRDCMEISVAGNSERILLISRYDNLGKGASGAAVQCMNLSLGISETKGLEL